MPIQPGDVPATWANVDDLEADLGYKPNTSIRQGVKEFIRWYRQHYDV